MYQSINIENSWQSPGNQILLTHTWYPIWQYLHSLIDYNLYLYNLIARSGGAVVWPLIFHESNHGSIPWLATGILSRSLLKYIWGWNNVSLTVPSSLPQTEVGQMSNHKFYISFAQTCAYYCLMIPNRKPAQEWREWGEWGEGWMKQPFNLGWNQPRTQKLAA